MKDIKKSKEKKTLAYLREPFAANQIGKLPKPTAKQTAKAKAPDWDGIKCKVCGGWHHKDVIHLDYVGHAALTDRFLDVDPTWGWEPLAKDEKGLPAFDNTGGLWVNLTILGVTRLGYGHAALSQYKDVGSREKEVIGDALRNAGMRFGCALDLWHKGDLHVDEEVEIKKKPVEKEAPPIDVYRTIDVFYKNKLPKLKNKAAEIVKLRTWMQEEGFLPEAFKYEKECSERFWDKQEKVNNG